jgi:hypothetical protein
MPLKIDFLVIKKDNSLNIMNSTIKDILKKASDFIADGKTTQAINELNKVSEIGIKYKNDLILSRNKLNRLTRKYHTGLITFDTYFMKKNKICHTLIDIIDEVESNSNPLEEKEPKKKPKTRKVSSKLLIIIFSISLLFTCAYFLKRNTCQEFFEEGKYNEAYECSKSLILAFEPKERKDNYEDSKFISLGDKAYLDVNVENAEINYNQVDNSIRELHLSKKLDIIYLVKNLMQKII